MLARYRSAYATMRRLEGRGDVAELRGLPYVREGPRASQWRIRARTYESFVDRVLVPLERERSGPLRVLDLGSGAGWLCHRLQVRGHFALALDWRHDDVDGLGAASVYRSDARPLFPRVAASFDALPFGPRSWDLAVFNASLHYSTDLRATLEETARALDAGGVIAILDSPFYRSEHHGAAMVAEKRLGRGLPAGSSPADLIALPSIEFLTRRKLEYASSALGISWRRHRVLYPLAYELRPLWARLRGRRVPSRFDVWEGRTARP